MILLTLVVFFMPAGAFAAEARLQISEECFATGAGKLSFYPDPMLQKCNQKKVESESSEKFGLLDIDDFPEHPVVSSSGRKIEMKWIENGGATISIDGVEKLRFSRLTASVEEPVAAAYWHGDDWVVEADGDVYVNGKKIRPGPFFSRAYYFRFLEGKPFFFFQRAFGSAGISFNGIIQPAKYDLIANGLCCEPGFANPRRSEKAVRFFGKRGSTWYLVTARVVP